MKVGFALEPIQGLTLDLIIYLMKKTLIEHFEFNWRIIPRVDRVLKTLGKTTTTLHLPIFNRDRFDFASEDTKYDHTREEVISFINQWNDQLNLIYTLAHITEDPNGKYELMFERLSQIESKIVLENVVGYSDEHFMEFYFQAKDYLGKQLAGHALDISHRYVNDWQNWLNVPVDLEKEIVYIHISDCTKTEDLHLPLGLGEMPYNDFFKYLKKLHYNGIIMQELKPNGDQADEIMNSTLACIKTFSKIKSLRMQIRHALVRRILKKRRDEFKDVINLSAEEIGYDFV
ncbi:MAG: sugar phosphate isomerase/epimerase [Asgard group archaeon]|nr:sugar phosphate isomerase/epimerase [Asgard group archaeon]